MMDSSPSAGGRTTNKTLPGQIVLVLQGGGALGSYQVGVYQALHEAGIEPDWIIGTSIGAINAGIITGNKPQDRLAKLNDFWSRMERPSTWPFVPAWMGISETWSYWSTWSEASPDFSSRICRRSGVRTSRWGWIAPGSIRPRPCGRRLTSWWIFPSSTHARHG